MNGRPPSEYSYSVPYHRSPHNLRRMTVQSRPGGRSTAWSPASARRSYLAAGISLLAVAALMAVWAVVGWVYIGQFNGAAERLFNTPAFADDDLAVTGVEFPYAGTILVASALAIVTAILGWAVLDRWWRARTPAFILGAVLTAFSVKVLLFNFIAAIEIPETGISDHLYRQSVRQFNALTAWKLSSWFQTFTVATGIIAIVLVVTACYLLRKSAPVYHPSYTLGRDRYR